MDFSNDKCKIYICIFTCAKIQIYANVYKHKNHQNLYIYIYMYIYICMDLWMYIYIFIFTYHVIYYTCTYTFASTCTCAQLHVYINMYTYVIRPWAWVCRTSFWFLIGDWLRVSLKERIGEGGFAEVWLGQVDFQEVPWLLNHVCRCTMRAFDQMQTGTQNETGITRTQSVFSGRHELCNAVWGETRHDLQIRRIYPTNSIAAT